MVYAYRLAGLYHILLGDVLLSEYEVVPHGPVEQPCVLQHHSEQGVDAFPRHVRGLYASYAYGTAVQFIEAHQQVYESGLSRTRRSYYGYMVARIDGEAEVLYYRPLWSVSEVHMIEYYFRVLNVVYVVYLSGLVLHLLFA